MRSLNTNELTKIGGGVDNIGSPSDFGAVVISSPPATFQEPARDDSTYEDWQKKQQAKLV